MTVSSFNSLSLAPPLVLFSVDAGAASLPLWRRAEGYAVNVLAENQKDMSDRFARSGANKWEGTTYEEGLFGAPACLASRPSSNALRGRRMRRAIMCCLSPR